MLRELTSFLVCIVILSSCTTKTKEVEDLLSVKVYVLDGGQMKINDLSYFTTGDEYDGLSITLVNPVFLIEHEKGSLLWDLAIVDSVADLKDRDTSATVISHVDRKLLDQLKTLNLTPDSIDFIAISHSHFDHIGNANYFQSSTWLMDQKEYNWAFSEERSDDHVLYKVLPDVDKIFYNDSYDVFGDSSVLIVTTPGHTPGHASLFVRLSGGKSIALTGDLYHFEEQRTFGRIPRFNVDIDETRRSIRKFEKLVMEWDAKVIIQHEQEQYLDLPKPPDFLQ